MLDIHDHLLEAKRYYNLDEYLFSEVAERFAQGHPISAFDFYAIVTWKANRAKTKVQKGLKKLNLSPTELLESVRDLPDREKLQRLDDVPGIGIPIASAILTVCYPERFTVLDYRAWEILYEHRHVTQKTVPGDVEAYFEYLRVCKELAQKLKLSLRELDVSLWGVSQKRDIEYLVSP